MGFISADKLEELAKPLMKSGYGQYLMQVLRLPN
jgi:glucose-1-phosphate thymidylyltransferase